MSKRVRYSELRFALEEKGDWSELTMSPYYWPIVREKVVDHLGERQVLITSLCGRGNGKKFLKFIEKHGVTIIKTYPIGESQVVRISASDLPKLGDSLWDLSFCNITSEITETDLNDLPHVYFDHWETGDYVNALRTRGHSFIGIVDDWSYTFLHSTDGSILLDILREEIARFVEKHSGTKVAIDPELAGEIAKLGNPFIDLRDYEIKEDNDSVTLTFILRRSVPTDRGFDVKIDKASHKWKVGKPYSRPHDKSHILSRRQMIIDALPLILLLLLMIALSISAIYGLYKLIAWLFF